MSHVEMFIEKIAILQTLGATLTGSRVFKNALNWKNLLMQADWDFFLQYTKGTFDRLIKNGFKELGNHNYLDCNTELVLTWSGGLYKIDVQLVKDAYLKRRIQSIIMKMNKPHMSKDMETLMWNLAHECLKKIEQEKFND